ncbi:MAG: TrkH family potassium uptake protein [Treponema sp.]|jgi:trk system potassium uptake protein TrkH|nr:TrkH family potassium uptake protein [Treponema sp.]
MRKLAIFRLCIVFPGFFSLAMIFPLVIALAFGEYRMAFAFGVTIGASAAVAVPAFALGGRPAPGFNTREGILFVCFAWFSACLLGAVPYYLSGYFPGFSDALFECVSGLTTTGITVLPDLEALPYSLHFWRAMTLWLGGMGTVVFAAGLASRLGAGGVRPLQETAGRTEERFAPGPGGAAKILCLVYCALTAVLFLLFFAGGMGWFDALFHALSAVSTGGFSTRNNGIAAFNSPYLEWVCAVFMLIAGFNFTLICRLARGKFRDIADNDEAKAYFAIILVSALVVGVSILPEAGSVEKALRRAFFGVVSVMTTTGLRAEDPGLWPPLAQMVVFMLMFTGGCSGSAAGGIKVIRHVVLFKQAKNETMRLLYPSGVFSLQLDKKPCEKHVVYNVAAFLFLYFLLLCLGTLLMGVSAGAGLFDSVNASAIALGNIGHGLGDRLPGGLFQQAPDYVKWGFSFLMIAGRLELFTVLILFAPGFWRG